MIAIQPEYAAVVKVNEIVANPGAKVLIYGSQQRLTLSRTSWKSSMLKEGVFETVRMFVAIPGYIICTD